MISKSHWVFLLLAVLVVLLVYRPLFFDGILISDDYEHHAARLGNYYLALQQGQYLPRWAPNLNGGFGYPVFNYSYHLPYLVGTVIHVLGASIQESLNGSIIFALIAGTIGTYFLVRVYGLHPRTSLLLSLAYMINPYFLLLIFWRGALGEIFAYVVASYVLLFLELGRRVWEPKRQALIFFLQCISLSALLLSHLPFAIIIIACIGGYVIVSGDKHVARSFCLATITALLLTAFYWVPAVFERSFTTYSSGEYLLQHVGQFVPLTELITIFRSINSSRFFLHVVQIGIFPLVACAIVLYQLQNLKQSARLEAWYWIVVMIASALLITPMSAFLWNSFSPMQMIQFPWRMLLVLNLASLIMIARFIIGVRPHLFVVEVLLAVSITASVFGYAHSKGTTSRSDYEWYQTIATTASFDEHRPIWFSVPERTMPDIYFFDGQPPVDNVLPNYDARLHVITNNGTVLNYIVEASSSGYLIHKRAFFPGWKATVDQVQTPISHDISQFTGLVAVPVDSGTHQIRLSFSESTPARTIGSIVTVIGLLALTFQLWRYHSYSQKL